MENVAALEVARLGDPVVGDDRIGAGAQHLADLLRRPDVEAALLALGVGVERRVEAALRPPHLAQRPVERLVADPAVALVAEDLPAVQVGAGEQRVVVEHLLEVGDEPGGVDRVAGEAAAELVVDAAGRHRVESALDDVGGTRGPAGTRARRRAGTWARRRSRRGACRLRCAKRRATASSSRRGSSSVRRGLELADRARAAPASAAARALISLAPLPNASTTASITMRKLGMPRRWLGREVGAAVEGHALGVEEDGHRPAALAGHRLHRLHVEGVDVGALLAVDLDVDEVLVHVGGRLGVLEGLALHHVAPVAGRVADREQDRAVLDRVPARAPPRPTGTSRPGCRGAGAGRGWSPRRGGWPCP